jgi:formyl-CoA transferase
VILVSISGFGQNGPYADYKVRDIVTTAMGGLLYISGDPRFPPCMPPETQSYYFGSLYAAYGALLALWQRETQGRGVHVDASIQASMAVHEHAAFTYSSERRNIKREGSQHNFAAPGNIFPCKDGYSSLVATQHHWPLLLEVWEDHPEELDNPRWMNNLERRAHADRINELVSVFTSRYNKEDLSSLLQKRGIPALPVNTPSDFFKDSQIRDRHFFQPVTHSVIGTYEQMSVPFLVDGVRAKPMPAPLLGQHNAEVYCGELGLTRNELDILVSDGIV